VSRLDCIFKRVERAEEKALPGQFMWAIFSLGKKGEKRVEQIKEEKFSHPKKKMRRLLPRRRRAKNKHSAFMLLHRGCC